MEIEKDIEVMEGIKRNERYGGYGGVKATLYIINIYIIYFTTLK